jgi:metallo-beta-lactamase family protein
VHIDGEQLDLRAKVHRLTGYSAHADQKGLVEWVKAMGEMPEEVRLVHGEAEGKKGMEKALESIQ